MKKLAETSASFNNPQIYKARDETSILSLSNQRAILLRPDEVLEGVRFSI